MEPGNPYYLSSFCLGKRSRQVAYPESTSFTPQPLARSSSSDVPPPLHRHCASRPQDITEQFPSCIRASYLRNSDEHRHSQRAPDYFCAAKPRNPNNNQSKSDQFPASSAGLETPSPSRIPLRFRDILRLASFSAVRCAHTSTRLRRPEHERGKISSDVV